MTVPFVPSGNRKIAQLPPTHGITDPATRKFADAMSNILQGRSGDIPAVSDQRFITEFEMNELVGKKVVDLFSNGVRAFGAPIPANNDGGPLGPRSIDAIQMEAAFQNLEDYIRRSILFQILGQQFQLPQISDLRAKFEKELAKQGYSIIQTQTATAGVIERVDGIAVRMGDAEAAIITEELIRADDDTALARVINTIWATINGGGSSIIEDGALAAAGSVGATASRWTAVVSAVTDPNTGNVNSASLRTQLNTYADAVNNRFAAIYTVRAQISVGGQTIMGGFGLSATTGTGSIGGPDSIPASINFGVRADTFFIAATSSTPDEATQNSAPANVPFIVVTNPITISGFSYTPGVWMRKAIIQNLQCTEATIATAAITTAKIGDLAVETIKIQDNAVTIPVGVTGGGVSVAGTTPVELASLTLVYASPAPGKTQISVNCVMSGTGSGASPFAFLLSLSINGSTVRTVNDSLQNDWGRTSTIFYIDATMGAGTHTIRAYGSTQQSTGQASILSTVISALGLKK